GSRGRRIGARTEAVGPAGAWRGSRCRSESGSRARPWQCHPWVSGVTSVRLFFFVVLIDDVELELAAGGVVGEIDDVVRALDRADHLGEFLDVGDRDVTKRAPAELEHVGGEIATDAGDRRHLGPTAPLH